MRWQDERWQWGLVIATVLVSLVLLAVEAWRAPSLLAWLEEAAHGGF